MTTRKIRDGAWSVWVVFAILCTTAVSFRQWDAAENIAALGALPGMVWAVAVVWLGLDK